MIECKVDGVLISKGTKRQLMADFSRFDKEMYKEVDNVSNSDVYQLTGHFRALLTKPELPRRGFKVNSHRCTLCPVE